ncbi:4-hydroxy-tetrahydrodipicolinate reductase [Salisaeta longa]|uniref:4-hydroxy-tetrahydrodipicolinate reductase n=1 Tax=Salisaeta longa TaxID=503170 RepID=UPI0003B3CB77|nr:4-hydroxy-tetrahydrodipicolinate reductase [Salisaeta longa]
MTLALVGTGQMGQAVAALAPDRGHTIAARFNTDRPLTDAAPAALAGVDAVIDFSLPDVALAHLKRYARWQVPAVMGTTGWYDARATVHDWFTAHDGTLLYAANFSLGIAVLRRALAGALPLLNALPDYDAFVHETHHNQKVDSPSGTAEMLAEDVLAALDRKTHATPEAQHERIDPAALHVSSTRVGTTFGEHTVGFDGAHDRLELSHRAKGRTGFAFGALRCAEWVQGRTGVFTLDDVLDDWLAPTD